MKKEPTFSKQELLLFDDFRHRKDLCAVLFPDEKKLSHTEAKRILNDFLNDK